MKNQSLKDAIEIICGIPIALAIFPMPLALPITIIMLAIEQPEETPLAIIYFSYLLLSLFVMYRVENKR